MKTAKLVIGIVSIVLALVMLFQSCAANVGSVLATAGTDMSGAIGTFAAILLIVAGIIGIAARKSKGGTIAAFIFYVPDRVGRCVAGVCRRVYHLCVCAALRAKSQVIANLYFVFSRPQRYEEREFFCKFLKALLTYDAPYAII